MACLEQIDEDYKLNPITQPKLDVEAIEMPDDGPMQFEMDVEVQPDFALPAYKALTVKRPVKDDHRGRRRGPVQALPGAVRPARAQARGGRRDRRLRHGRPRRSTRDGSPLNEAKEIQFRLQPELRFQDGRVPDLDKVLVGAKPGESARGRGPDRLRLARPGPARPDDPA